MKPVASALIALAFVSTLLLPGLAAASGGGGSGAWVLIAGLGSDGWASRPGMCCGALYVPGWLQPSGGPSRGLLLKVGGNGVEASLVETGKPTMLTGITEFKGGLCAYGRINGLPGIALIKGGSVSAYAIKAVGKWSIVSGSTIYARPNSGGGLDVVVAAKGSWGFFNKWFTLVVRLDENLNPTRIISVSMPPPKLALPAGDDAFYLVAPKYYGALHIIKVDLKAVKALGVAISMAGFDLEPASALLAGGKLYIIGTAVKVKTYDERGMIIRLTPELGVEAFKLLRALSVNEFEAAARSPGGLYVSAVLMQPEHNIRRDLVLEIGSNGEILRGVEVKGLKPDLEVTGIMPGEGSLLLVGSLVSWKLPSRSPLAMRIPWPPKGNHTLTGGMLKAVIVTLPQPYLENLQSRLYDAKFKVAHTSYNVTLLNSTTVKIGEVEASLEKVPAKVYMLREAAATGTPTTTTRTGMPHTKVKTTKTTSKPAATSTTPQTAAPTGGTASQGHTGTTTSPPRGRGGVSRAALLAGGVVAVIVVVAIAVALARR